MNDLLLIRELPAANLFRVLPHCQTRGYCVKTQHNANSGHVLSQKLYFEIAETYSCLQQNSVP